MSVTDAQRVANAQMRCPHHKDAILVWEQCEVCEGHCHADGEPCPTCNGEGGYVSCPACNAESQENYPPPSLYA
jgi:DnaJ-class molecular chaperone